jgi:uncharacterized protein YbjT (DUF2867 family)
MASKTNKKILILGATGPMGMLTAKEALAHHFKITIFVRNPEKVPQEVKDNPNVTVRNLHRKLSCKLTFGRP